jgi:uncharacterized protein YbbC (DUF1343 family)
METYPDSRTGTYKVCLGVALLLLGGSLLLAADRSPQVLNGIDVLREQKFAPLAGKRIGLLTNQTGLASDGAVTIDLLYKSGVCRLVALFSPEHGIRGTMDSKVNSSVDEATGLPIYSLYGDRTRPSAEMLRGLDALVVDLQDIGARFYTYATTMGYCMEEAAKAGISFYVLDRPNPIGGLSVEGPMLDADRTSFTAYSRLPVRHGMTLGELARYFNAENKIGVDLHVVPMTGWQREYYFYDTGQLWVNPSPNIRGMTATVLYPGVCLLERTNVSIGRGTDKPFETVGAPWVDPRVFASALNLANVPGIRFIPTFFTPSSGTNQGKQCGGVSLVLTDISKFNSVLAGLTLISVLNKLYPNLFDIDKVMQLLGSSQALKAIVAGESPATVLRAGIPDMKDFLSRRQRVLIYGQSPSGKERER